MGIFSKRTRGAYSPVASMTAGGATYTAASYTDATHVNQLRQGWQKKIFDIYDTEGHLFYATNYIGGAMSRIRLVAAKKNKKDGEFMRPIIIEKGPVSDLVRGIQSSKGGQSSFLRQVGRNMFLVGEVWVVASDVFYPNGATHTFWDAISVDEIVSGGSNQMKFQRRSLPGAQPVDLPKGSSAFRLWKEHPRWSELADSGSRSCMELLEKIIVLNRAEKAIARSQLAGSGILALPQELVPPAWQNQGSTPNPMASNPLWEALAESMTAPLRDESAVSAVVPLLLVGPGDMINKIKYEPLARSFDTQASQSSITNAIEQIANTLDIPKEILLGLGSSTHWTAWSVREDVFQAHVQPLIELVCESLTRTFLQQGLANLDPTQLAAIMKDLEVDSVDDIVVWYDASQLILRPDSADKATAAHDRLVITDEAYARAQGIPNEDILDKASPEYAKRIGVKMVDSKMAISGTPTEPPAPAAPGAAPASKGGGGGVGVPKQ